MKVMVFLYGGLARCQALDPGHDLCLIFLKAGFVSVVSVPHFNLHEDKEKGQEAAQE